MPSAAASAARRTGTISTSCARPARMLVLPDGGYTAHRDGEVVLLAAAEEGAGRTLLRAGFARTPPGGRAAVAWLTTAQAWAFDVSMAAVLELRPEGALFFRGETGSFTPYLPS